MYKIPNFIFKSIYQLDIFSSRGICRFAKIAKYYLILAFKNKRVF